MQHQNSKWVPNIYYEENDKGITGGLPFIDIPIGHSIPACLFICGAKDYRDLSQETKDNLDLEHLEKEITIHSYANMTVLKEKLSPELFDEVRIAIGLQPLQIALLEGAKKTLEIQKNIDNLINRINETNSIEEE
jgi:hypothetical protein